MANRTASEENDNSAIQDKIGMPSKGAVLAKTTNMNSSRLLRFTEKHGWYDVEQKGNTCFYCLEK